MPRFRISSLIVLVATIAGGLGAMRVGSELLAKGFASLSVIAMMLGLTGAIILRRASWIGFTVFIWGYANPLSLSTADGDLAEYGIKALAEALHSNTTPRPPRPTISSPFLSGSDSLDSTSNAMDLAFDRLFLDHNLDDTKANLIHTDGDLKVLKDYQAKLRAYHDQAKLSQPRQKNAVTIGTACLALVLGWIGAFVGRFMEKCRTSPPLKRPVDPEPATTP